MEYDIELKPNSKPVRLPPYRTGFLESKILKEQIERWIKAGICKSGISSFAAPVLLVRKARPGQYRCCLDLRSVNKLIELPSFPTMTIDQFTCLMGEGNFQYYTTIDISNAFNQIKLTPRSQKICSFVTEFGSYICTRMPFGLSSSGIIFNQVIDRVLGELKSKCSIAYYIDDIIIFNTDLQSHLRDVEMVLKRFREVNLKIGINKLNIAHSQIQFLGYKFSSKGMEITQDGIDKIRNYPPCKTKTEIRSFLGVANYQRRFIKGFAHLTKPLTDLLKKGTRFVWSPECQDALDKIKKAITNPPILVGPDYNSKHKLIVETDASLYSTGWALSQVQLDKITNKEVERPIIYGGRSFTSTQMKYDTVEREMLAVIFAFERLNPYIRYAEFTLIVDNLPLKHILNKPLKGVSARWARWIMLLSNYNFTCVHRPGKKQILSDSLSRMFYNNASDELNIKTDPSAMSIEKRASNRKVNEPKNDNKDNVWRESHLIGYEPADLTVHPPPPPE